MKSTTSFLGSTLRQVCAVSVAALVAASAISAVPKPTLAAETPQATASEVDKRIAEISRALVTVSVTRSPNEAGGLSLVPDNDLLGEFFHRFGDGDDFPNLPFERGGRVATPEVFTGSGVVIDSEGLIVTAEALVTSADRINVETRDGETLSAELVGRDLVSGLALLRVEAANVLPAATWSETALALGQPVFTIGRSGEYGTLLSSGHVAATIGSGDLLLDDEASPVLLGAPIADENGRILAIRTQNADPTSGMIVAIGADKAREVINELAEKGAVARGYLGVSIQPVTQDLASALGLERAYGAIVADVQPGTPAETAGLKTGDVILSLDDETVASPATLSQAVGARDPGDEVRLAVLRDGDEIGIDVKLAALPGAHTTPGGSEGVSVPELGVSLQALSPDLRDAFGLSEDVSGLVVTKVGETAADELQTGDVIVSVYRDQVETIEDVVDAADKAKSEGRSSLLLLIDRDGARIFVPVPLASS